MPDSRCHSEHLERVRRIAVVEHAAGRLPDFEPERPWDNVHREVTKDHAYWADNVDRPAMLFATKISTFATLTDNGFGSVALSRENIHRTDEQKSRQVRKEEAQQEEACKV